MTQNKNFFYLSLLSFIVTFIFKITIYCYLFFASKFAFPIFVLQFSITRFQFSFLLLIDHTVSVWKVSRMILDVDYKRIRLRWKMCQATFTTGGGTFHLNCRAKSRKRSRSWKGFVGTSKALVQQGDVISFFKSSSNDFVTFYVFPWDRIVLDYWPLHRANNSGSMIAYKINKITQEILNT